MIRTNLFTAICRALPEKISSETLLGMYELMQKTDQLSPFRTLSSLQENKKAFLSHRDSIRRAGGYIEDQQSYADMTYGASTVSRSGCGIIAAYNALYTLHGSHPVSLPDMIREFEAEGMVLSGRWGTSPKSLYRYMQRKGYRTEFSTDPASFDSMGTRYPSLILTVYNNAKDIRDALHIIHISAAPSGFLPHNAGRASAPAASVTELLSDLNHGQSGGICLLGISLCSDPSDEQ